MSLSPWLTCSYRKVNALLTGKVRAQRVFFPVSLFISFRLEYYIADLIPTISISTPITARINPIKRVTMPRPFSPIANKIFELDIKQINVMKHKTANTIVVTVISIHPPAAE